MTTIDISKLSTRERKAYESGMAEVRRKLSEGKTAAIERHNLKIARNREVVAKRLGATLAAKVFGVPLPAATKRAPRGSLQNQPAMPQAMRKVYCTGRRIAGRETKRISSTTGLF